MVFETNIIYHLIEYLSYTLILYIVYHMKREDNVFTIPLLSSILLLSISPYPLTTAYDFILGYLLIVSTYLIICSHGLKREDVVYGLAYLVFYFFLGVLPYILSNCYTLSRACLSISGEVNLFTYVFIILGFISIITLSTILYNVRSSFKHAIFYFTSLTYLIMNYLVLIKLLNNPLYLMITIMVLSLITYVVGSRSGKYLYGDLELNIVFDKYVSLNAPLIFIVLALALIYQYMVSPF